MAENDPGDQHQSRPYWANLTNCLSHCKAASFIWTISQQQITLPVFTLSRCPTQAGKELWHNGRLLIEKHQSRAPLPNTQNGFTWFF